MKTFVHIEQQNTHPTAGSQKHTSPSQERMSKTPDRRRQEGPAKSEAQRGLLSGGPWPDQVHRAPGPSTSRPKAEGPFLWWVPPRVHGAGSSAAGCVGGFL